MAKMSGKMTAKTAAATTATATAAALTEKDGELPMEGEIALPIFLCDRLYAVAVEAESFKLECGDLAVRAEDLSKKLHSLAAILLSATSFSYDRPVRRITTEATKRLERAIALARRCRRAGILQRVVTITSAADFRKILSLLDASLGDLRWLLSLFSGSAALDLLTLPPIASSDPILGWVWSHIAIIQMSPVLQDRAEAAASLAQLADDNETYRKAIVEEGGVPPLLRLLNEPASPAAQIAAATTLTHLATLPERVQAISNAIAVIVHVLSASASAKVQISVAALVAKMAALDSAAQEEFGRENAIRPLISALSSDPGGGGRGYSNPDVRLEMKIKCAEALWMLTKGGNVANSRRITEQRGLLCLTGLVLKEGRDLQYNCMMTLAEICAAAASNADLRRSAFKASSPQAKAVVDELLAMAEGASGELQIAAIRSIGSLAQTFPARETRVISPLVKKLSHWNPEVAIEAVIALGKFVGEQNFNRVEHSKTIIEFEGVSPLMKMLRLGDKAQLHGLVLLCCLAVNAGDNEAEALMRAGALPTLEQAARSPVAQHPLMKDLIAPAVGGLELFHAGIRHHGQL